MILTVSYKMLTIRSSHYKYERMFEKYMSRFLLCPTLWVSGVKRYFFTVGNQQLSHRLLHYNAHFRGRSDISFSRITLFYVW